VAVVATAIVAAVALILVFTRSDGASNQQRGEVFLQSAGSTGADPFTESTAKESDAPTATPSLPSTATGDVAQSVHGDAPGLYGGTRNVASCDVEKQITVLKAAPSKNAAFASVLGIQPSAVPGYLRTLTPVQLRADTRVTNHGYRNGSATSYQAVLQAGTAVLVDDRGVPRVRCACGNPMTPPAAQQTDPKPVGESWSGYRPSHVVVVAPAPRPVKKFVVAGPEKGDWFTRDQGDHRGEHDRKTTPPPPPTGPSTPGKEQTPSNGKTSPGPGTPSKPSESGKPSKSSESGKPSKPSESGKPSKSSESGKSSEPGKPSKSSESGKSSEPGKPSKSSGSSKPSASDKESSPSKDKSSSESGKPSSASSGPSSPGSSEPSSQQSAPSSGESSKPQEPSSAPSSLEPGPKTSAPQNTAPENSGPAPADTGQEQQQEPQEDQQQEQQPPGPEGS
jgi:hypothetical protein